MMRLGRASIGASACFLFLIAAAQAETTKIEGQPLQPQAAAADADEARYSFHRMGDGFVRLDSRTGDLAQCGWASIGWTCKPVPDERAALDSEIERLRRENAALKKSLLTNGLAMPKGIVADELKQSAPVPPADVPDPSQSEPRGPGNVDLDRAVAFVKRVWRRLVDMMTDLQRDIQKKS